MGTPSKNLVSFVSPTPDRSPVHLDLSLIPQTARACATNSLDLSGTGIVFPSPYNAICSQDAIPGPISASDGFAEDGSLPATMESLHARISTGVGTEKDCSPRLSSSKVVRDHDQDFPEYTPHMSVPHWVSVSSCSPACCDKSTQALRSCKHAVPVGVFVDTETDANVHKHIVIPHLRCVRLLSAWEHTSHIAPGLRFHQTPAGQHLLDASESVNEGMLCCVLG